MKLNVFASNQFASIVLAAAAFCVTSLGSTEEATAVYAGGAYAKALSAADNTCANYGYGYLSNSCTTSKSFIMPLHFTSEGYKNISFVAQGVSAASDVSCKASSANTSNGYVTTAYASLSSPYTTAQTVSVGSLYVFDPGTFYLLCTIAPNAKLYMASWDQ
jgi:hypothetical protein